MTTSDGPYWRTSILTNRFFNNDKSKDPTSKINEANFLQSSLLHSARLKKTLEESRKAFFNIDTPPKTTVQNNSNIVDKTPLEVGANKRISVKKISFKVKKTSSIHRKNSTNINRMSAVKANSVAELTSRFNKFDDTTRSRLLKCIKNKEDASCRNKSQSDDQKQIHFTRKPSINKRKTSFRTFADAKNKREIGKVKSTIEIFETITSTIEQKACAVAACKPKVPEKKFGPEVIEIVNKNNSRFLCTNKKDQTNSTLSDNLKISIIAQTLNADDKKTDFVQILNIPLITKRSESKYETLNVSRVATKQHEQNTHTTTEIIDDSTAKIPNKSFLWSRCATQIDILEELYDQVDPPQPQHIDKIYEDIRRAHDEEYSTKYEELDDDGYEYCENIYETLPVITSSDAHVPAKRRAVLVPVPPSRNAPATAHEQTANGYESVYNRASDGGDADSNYESIDECAVVMGLYGGGSVVSAASSDERSNSLYVYGKCRSDSDRTVTDEWVDLSDDNVRGDDADSIVLVKEKPKIAKRNSGWSQKCREQRKKAEPTQLFDEYGDTDSDHIYESLCGATPKGKQSPIPQQKAEEEHDVYDSFDSDSECDHNTQKDITNAKLPQLPINQTSVSTIAKTLRKNFTKSFHKITKRKCDSENLNTKSNVYQNITLNCHTTKSPPPQTNCQQAHANTPQQNNNNKKSSSIFHKFRRSVTFVSDTFIADVAPSIRPSLHINRQRPNSTFYLTDITIDKNDSSIATNAPITGNALANARPPATPNAPPIDNPSYATDCGVVGTDKRASRTNWYADVGLYRRSCGAATPPASSGASSSLSSSAENSGGTTSASAECSDVNDDGCVVDGDDCRLLAREEYYNMRNAVVCDSGGGVAGEGGKSQRWLDEPLYQFYDAAILESEYKDSTRNFDYDGYEEVGKIRPTVMELIAPIKNSIGIVARTLWCEVPEVLQSAVLSSLSETQQKIQEAKFEMLTSEASYLHSLNVLVDHFVKNIKHSELLTDHEFKRLFGNIFAVKDCSEKLLADLEKCWQDNILLTNICDIVNKHAEDNFQVYVTFCENQIFLDTTLNKLKERLSFSRYLEQLERSAACHSLKLNSFLLLPMQRITRWRLLVDAVLKRLVVEDDEYLSSRNTMATLTKVAQQCNEAARNMERTLEIREISRQLEFGKGVPPVDILDNGGGSRFLIKSGPLTQMVAKTGDLKVTFGKRFAKIALYLFLFNDILLITKARSKDNYLVLHYCYRNFIEINSEDSLESLPLKNAQGRHLIFLTILENHEEKLVEFLLSCESVSDKERWLEAILPPKSENPDEIIYENWDCPQVTAVHNYAASQPDEMSLVKGDVINVDKKLTDGWYHGEKISDCQIGWFPSNYTTTITNQHVRARNLKMRYRLLAFSTNYLLNNQ